MPATSAKGKATLLLVVGIVLLIGGALFILVGVLDAVGFTQTTSSGTTTVLIEALALCFPTAVVPGILLTYVGWKRRRSDQKLEEFSAWVKTYRRIGLGDLANKLAKSPYEAEKTLMECVEQGLLDGFIDRSTNEFVLQRAAGQEHFIGMCPGCGNSLQRRYLDGETVTCPYCNTVIVGSSSPRGTGPPP